MRSFLRARARRHVPQHRSGEGLLRGLMALERPAPLTSALLPRRTCEPWSERSLEGPPKLCTRNSSNSVGEPAAG